MDYHPKNLKKKNSNILEKLHKKSKKLSECSSKINVEHNMNRDFDNKTLNLFKGIVKIKNTSSKKQIKEQNIESNSANNKNIFQFTNFLYNNEEHLHKNQIHILKNSEKEIPSPIKSFTHKLSINEKYFKKTKRTMKLSKEKNESDIKKDLFKRSSYNLSGLSLKKKSHKNLFIKNKFGNSTNTNHKSHKDYSFFSKLKEKEKNPSKTPYLDTKFWKTSYDVTKFVTNDTNSKSPIHKRSSKMSLFNKSQSPKKKKNYMDENDNNKEKIFINKESIKKSLVNDKDDNNAIIVNKKDLQKKEIKRHENNDNSNESEYCLECKKKGNNISSIIVNILNKPFFCCLKP